MSRIGKASASPAAAPIASRSAPAPQAVGTQGVEGSDIPIDVLVNDAKLSRLRRAKEVTRLEAVDAVKRPGVPYRVVRGGPVELFHGSIVEGSIDHKGLQPHYVVDLQDPRVDKILKTARALRDEALDFHQRCAAVREVVAGSLKGKKYDDHGYLGLLQNARRARQNVRPGDYVDIDAGVCREHAMLTHLALREAGVESRYLYARVRSADGAQDEDHAVALAFDAEAWDRYGHDRDVSKAWVVDAYNGVFDGRRVESFQQQGGSRRVDESRPDVDAWLLPRHWLGYTLTVVDYPNYWVPVRAAPPADLPKDFDPSTCRLRVVRFDKPLSLWDRLLGR